MTAEARLIAELESASRNKRETCIVPASVLADVLSALTSARESYELRGQALDRLLALLPDPRVNRDFNPYAPDFDGRAVDTSGMTPICIEPRLCAEDCPKRGDT